MEYTEEEFDTVLAELVEKESGILQIPGIHEIMAKYLNNEVLDIIKERQLTEV